MEVCNGSVQWMCVMEVCNGGVQWKCAMEVCNGGVQWRCAMEVCDGVFFVFLSIPCKVLRPRALFRETTAIYFHLACNLN